MTLSEYIQAKVITELLAGRDGSAPPGPLCCRNGLVLQVERPDDGRDPAGPWGWFAVTIIAHPRGSPSAPSGKSEQWQAGALLVLLEDAGWPESQLGRRWKRKANVVIHRVPVEE